MAKERREDSEEKCPDCGGRLIYKDNEIYCRECGLVVDDCPVDSSEEGVYIDHTGEGNQKRTGDTLGYIDGYGGNRKLPPTRI